ncbi:MAG TPA: hypothetical protein VEV63_10495 [Streptosporangiaceae bacterium]|nr:hypothetical protein [Streptosporangiaceae bacterium]
MARTRFTQDRALTWADSDAGTLSPPVLAGAGSKLENDQARTN